MFPQKEAENPEKIKTMLTALLQRAREIAINNGIDFDEVIRSIGRTSGKPQLPPPPAPPSEIPSRRPEIGNY